MRVKFLRGTSATRGYAKFTKEFDNVAYSADYHNGHGNIIKYCNRPFLMKEDQEALERNGGTWHRGSWKGDGSANHRMSWGAVDLMNKTIIDNTNKIVGENDALFFLGDWAFDRNNLLEACRKYRNQINCKNVYFIWGNHDDVDIRMEDIFSGCYDCLEIEVDGQRMSLSHYAQFTWNKSHRGTWDLYGHSHANLEEWADKVMPGRRSMDVGIDNAYKILGEYRPFLHKEIGNIMSKRNGFSADHHEIKE